MPGLRPGAGTEGRAGAAGACGHSPATRTTAPGAARPLPRRSPPAPLCKPLPRCKPPGAGRRVFQALRGTDEGEIMTAAEGGCTRTRCEPRDGGCSPPAPASTAPRPRCSARAAASPVRDHGTVAPCSALPVPPPPPPPAPTGTPPPSPRREAGRRWMRRRRRPAPCSIPARGDSGTDRAPAADLSARPSLPSSCRRSGEGTAGPRRDRCPARPAGEAPRGAAAPPGPPAPVAPGAGRAAPPAAAAAAGDALGVHAREPTLLFPAGGLILPQPNPRATAAAAPPPSPVQRAGRSGAAAAAAAARCPAQSGDRGPPPAPAARGCPGGAAARGRRSRRCFPGLHHGPVVSA
ncbi:collagen alpha-1(I) chain-like [Melospiza melodia melodia]|uniref:collagen alpha-1(I) chain-like n=1 Tax=Melospiza melodia melodia TaxID=1914991 RepID=UPI002FD48DC9